MTTPTRRISFYLKPAAVKSEREACNYLDSLPASERSQRNARHFWLDWHSLKTILPLLTGWLNGQRGKYACQQSHMGLA